MKSSLAALCMSLVGVGLIHGPAPAQADTSAPIALVGSAVVPLERVVITAFPQNQTSAGERFQELRLDSVVEVGIDGQSWSVALDPKELTADYFYSGGVADFTIYMIGAGQTWMSTASARAVVDFETGEGFWTDPATSAPMVGYIDEASRSPRATSPARMGGKAYESQSADTVPEVEDDGVIVDTGTLVDGALVPGAGCYTEATSTYSTPWSTIGTTYPIGNSTAYMAVSSAEGSTFGIAVSASNQNGTWSAAGSKFASAGWSFTWSESGNARSYRKEVEYRKYKKTCVAAGGNSSTQWLWRPVQETGGVDKNTNIVVPTWTTCAIVTPGTWQRDQSGGHAYSYGSAVKWRDVLGVDLSIKREYSSASKMVYQIRGSNKKMCGNNDYPATAGKVQERTR